MQRTARFVLLPAFLWAVAGLAAGVLNGLLGAAGGILLVAVIPHLPTPEWLSATPWISPPRLDQRDVLATALCVMLPTSAVSFLLYAAKGIHPDPSTLWAIILPAMAGGWLGAYLLGRIPRKALRKAFALLVVVSGIRMIF